MRRLVRPVVVVVVAAVAAAGGVLLISGDDEADRAGQPAQAPPAAPAPDPAGRDQDEHPEGGEPERGVRAQVQRAIRESKPARLDPGQRAVARVVRAYVSALDTRDGARVCALFQPGALAQVELPRDRGTCRQSLSASIGYRDPRGFPVFTDSRVARVQAVALDGVDARVTATLVTGFASGREPSVEDDVVYLRRRGGRWLVVKPSAALYRAIGVGDIPPSVLAPP